MMDEATFYRYRQHLPITLANEPPPNIHHPSDARQRIGEWRMILADSDFFLYAPEPEDFPQVICMYHRHYDHRSYYNLDTANLLDKSDFQEDFPFYEPA